MRILAESGTAASAIFMIQVNKTGEIQQDNEFERDEIRYSNSMDVATAMQSHRDTAHLPQRHP